MNRTIETIIAKYLTNSATKADIDILSKWIEIPANRNVFIDYVQAHYAISHIMNNDDSKETVEKLLKTIRKEKRVPFKLMHKSIYKYAAAAILLLMVAITVFLNRKEDSFQFNEPIIVNNQIETGTDKATLTLENGEEVTLTRGGAYQTSYAVSNGEEIVYSSTDKAEIHHSKEIAYNYLTIPRGGQFQLTLSDGTEVWLNSESQLKYPVNFVDGQTRQVELVYGEAYFDVTPSADNNGRAFKVFNQSQEVEVLGTEFNIKAYKDENHIYTTLVEGKVAVNNKNLNTILKPNQQSNLDITNNKISVSTIDTKMEISWKDGIFRFKEMPLRDIIKVLSRWYDFNVVFENVALKNDNTTFKGVLEKGQNVKTILLAMKNSKTINDYEINNKTITLK